MNIHCWHRGDGDGRTLYLGPVALRVTTAILTSTMMRTMTLTILVKQESIDHHALVAVNGKQCSVVCKCEHNE